MNSIKIINRFVDKHPFIYTILVSLFIFALLNMGSYFYLSFKYKSQERKLKELNSQHQVLSQSEVLERIHGNKKVSDYKLVAEEQTIPLKYVPFVEYVEAPRTGKFVNVSELGVRCNFKLQEDCNSLKGGGDEIWVFGGSTTFGYGVKDDETIPAYLAKILPEYRIFNFGAASYYSTLERIRFENLLTFYNKPKTIIFIDGLNDFYYFDVPDESAMSSSIRESLKESLASIKNQSDSGFLKILKRKIRRLALYRLLHPELENLNHTSLLTTPSATVKQLNSAIRRLEMNNMLVSAIASNLGIEVLFVKQPIPTYGVGHKTSKVPAHMLNFGSHLNSGIAYKLMRNKDSNLKCSPGCILDLSEFGINQPMYVDTVHYTPQFNKAIAERISQKLSK